MTGMHCRNVVVVVDDDHDLLMSMAELLSWQGFEVHTACCGEDALSLVRSTSAAVVISDIEMPGIGGIELARQLRHEHLGSLLIAVSGSPSHLLDAAVLFDYTMAKPVSLPAMEKLLKGW